MRNMQLHLGAAIAAPILFILAFNADLFAQDVNGRYMYRVPDWLWKQQRFAAMIPPETRRSLEYDIQVLNALADLDDDSAHDEKGDQIARQLSGLLALRDLTADTITFEHLSENTRLALQVDPEFSQDARVTICDAAERFLTVALDDSVIQEAIDSSIDTPSPMPEMYELEDGSPKKDEFGNNVYTPGYAFYLRQRHRPKDVASFKSHFRQALSTPTGDAALLVISQYAGNVWWGGGYYDFYHQDVQQLSRLRPSRGFMYIRLNADKLNQGEAHYDDPVFWASKIAHEVLHNIGYWHPGYTDPAHRDANNQGNTKAFIVAYESEIYSKLAKKRGNSNCLTD